MVLLECFTQTSIELVAGTTDIQDSEPIRIAISYLKYGSNHCTAIGDQAASGCAVEWSCTMWRLFLRTHICHSPPTNSAALIDLHTEVFQGSCAADKPYQIGAGEVGAARHSCSVRTWCLELQTYTQMFT